MSEARALSIDVVSDVICPWCLIGSRRLDRALAELPDVKVELAFHPFLLDPKTPVDGKDLRAFLRAKYGDPEPMFRRVESVAKEDGVPLDFSKVTRAPSTVKAHTLIRHAAEKGPSAQHALAKALFGAYFLEGLDVGDDEVLARLAAGVGFKEAEARALIGDSAELATTREQATAWSQRGVSGVPFVIFGKKLAVSGAQPVALFKQALERAAAEAPQA